MEYLIIGVLVFGLLIAAIAILLYKRSATEKENKRTGKYPEGYYLSMGMALGVALGLPIGLAMGNIALGPAIGVAIGVAIGTALESKYKDKLRPLTDEEKEARKKKMLFLSGALILGMLALFALLLLNGGF